MSRKNKDRKENVNEKQPKQAPIITEENENAAFEEPQKTETEQPPKNETDAEPETVSMTKVEFEEVRSHIEKLQKEKDDAIQLAQRTQADFENYRRRNATLRTDSLDEGKRKCITELLPVLDNFDRAFDTVCSDENWKKGIELVQRQLMDALSKLGMEEIPAEGKFDPNFHNAVMQEKVEGKSSGEILQVFQKGYRVGEKIIRYSMVKVAE